MNKKQCVLSLAVLFTLSIVLISLSQKVEAVAYKQGSYGTVVTQIQQKLTNYGYYSYTIDGIYGSRTTFSGTGVLPLTGFAGMPHWPRWASGSRAPAPAPTM